MPHSHCAFPSGSDRELGVTGRAPFHHAAKVDREGGCVHHHCVIHFYHVTKRFPNRVAALNDVSFQVEKGDFVFLTGPSGAGKSTLLKLILRQLTPSDGQIIVNGRNLAAISGRQMPYFRREIGMIFQDFKLIDRMTIYENLSFVMTAVSTPQKEQKRKAYAMLRMMDLHHRLNSFPKQLSGGEQQRVAIARALINNPLVLIADEPTGNLDPEMANEILDIFIDANLRGSTVLVATHDSDLIRRAAKRSLVLDKGRLIEERPPAEEPTMRRASDFVNWT